MNSYENNNNSSGDEKLLYDEVCCIEKNIVKIEADIVRIEQSLTHDNKHIAEDLRDRNRKQLEHQLSSARKTLVGLTDLRCEAMWKIKIIDRVGGIAKTPTDLIEHFINKHNIEIQLNNFLGKCDDQTIEATDAIRIRLQLINDELKLGFKERIINYAFSEYIAKNSIRRRKCLKEAVRYDGDARQSVWDQLGDTCFTKDDPVYYTIAVIRKFIWQVKRKMASLPVYDHIMPVIFGAQGKGKTQFIQRFVGPICENVSYPNLKEITDSRNRQLWKRWVLIVDEMEGYERADVDALKNVITKTIVSGRILTTHEDFNEINSASLIGASNKTLDELIKDGTGMRRFIQLNWADMEESGWKVVNGIDYLGLWKSIDETGEDPLKQHRDYTRTRQEEFRQKSLVEQWITDDQRDYGLYEGKEWTNWKSSSLLHVENFLPWYRSRYGSGSFSQTRFGKEMRKLEGKLIEYRRGGAAIKYRLISQSFLEINDDDDRSEDVPSGHNNHVMSMKQRASMRS